MLDRSGMTGPKNSVSNMVDEEVESNNLAAALENLGKLMPVIAAMIVLASFGLSYLGDDIAILGWSVAAALMSAAAFVTFQKAREALTPQNRRIWQARIIAALWIASAAWALIAFLQCDSCSTAAFPFFKAALILVALTTLSLSAIAIPHAPVHIFLPGIAVTAFLAVRGMNPYDIGLAATLSIFMLFVTFLASRLTDADTSLDKKDRETQALNKALAESLARAEAAAKDARQANRSKSAFLAAMSHDLRTPLNAIIGFSEIMKDEMMGPFNNRRYRDYAGDIHRSGQHLLDMIDGVLDLSRLEAGGYRLSEKPVYLADVIEASATMARIEADRRRIEIVTDIDATLTPLLADGRALRQILGNLLSNAIKFSGDGSTIAVLAQWNDKSGQTLAVSDQGYGMEEDTLRKATIAFERGGETANTEGFGLGLAIVKELTEAHQARFSLISATGKGTTASIVFAAARVLNRTELQVDLDENAPVPTIQMPVIAQASLPFEPDTIEIEMQPQARPASPASRASGKERLTAALKRRQRRGANDADGGNRIDADLEADILAAFDAETAATKPAKAANAA